jgi:hypothetical protein
MLARSPKKEKFVARLTSGISSQTICPFGEIG